MCLAFADCAYNDDGIDQIAYDIYGPGGHNDAHSTTGFNTFVKPLNTKVLDLELPNGEHTAVLPEQKVVIKRNGTPMEVHGSDLLETDEFITKESLEDAKKKGLI